MTNTLAQDVQRVVDSIGGLPTNYLGTDIETSGYKRDEDMIVATGFCWVHDKVADSFTYHILNWADFDQELVPRDWLRSRLDFCAQGMEASGAGFHGVDLERMREAGDEPIERLHKFADLLTDAISRNYTLVGHSISGFDKPFIEAAVEEYTGRKLRLPEELILDTAALERAVQLGQFKRPNESRFAFLRRILTMRVSGIRYRLATDCVPKYGLDKRFNLDMQQAHKNPGFDALLCHLLVEHWRGLLPPHSQNRKPIRRLPPVRKP